MNLWIKALIWRVGGTAFSTIAAYAITGSVTMAAGVGSAEFVGKLLMYYLYERLWAWRGEQAVENARDAVAETIIPQRRVA